MASPAGAGHSNVPMAVVQRKRQKIKELFNKSQARPHSSSSGNKIGTRSSTAAGLKAAHSFSKGRKPRPLTDARKNKIQKFFNQTSATYQFEDIGTDVWKEELLFCMNEAHYGLEPSDVDSWIDSSSDFFYNAYLMGKMRNSNAIASIPPSQCSSRISSAARLLSHQDSTNGSEAQELSDTNQPRPLQPAAVSLATVKMEPESPHDKEVIPPPHEELPQDWAPPVNIYEVKSEPEDGYVGEMEEATLQERDQLLQQLLLAYSGNVGDLLTHVVETVLPPGNQSMELMAHLMNRVIAKMKFSQ